MTTKFDFIIENLTPVPCVTNDGDNWALDAMGNQLMLPPGVMGWAYDPASLSADIVKYYVTFKEDSAGNRVIDKCQIFGLRGDFPVLAGLPVQEIWTKYKYLRRLTEPAPEPPPTPAPAGVTDAEVAAAVRTLIAFIRQECK